MKTDQQSVITPCHMRFGQKKMTRNDILNTVSLIFKYIK